MAEPEPQQNNQIGGAGFLRPRPPPVWRHLDEVITVVDGVEQLQAKCKFCSILLHVQRRGPTGHLTRHHDAHLRRGDVIG